MKLLRIRENCTKRWNFLSDILTYVSLQMKSMIADQDKETSDEQTLSEEKDRFDDEKGKKKAWVLAFNHTPQGTVVGTLKKSHYLTNFLCLR